MIIWYTDVGLVLSAADACKMKDPIIEPRLKCWLKSWKTKSCEASIFIAGEPRLDVEYACHLLAVETGCLEMRDS